MKVCSYIFTIFYVFFLASASTSAGHGFSAGGVNIPEGPGPLVLLLGLGFGSFLLIFNIQKTKIMTSGPITLREIDGETVETVSDFIFGGSKITADGDCTHEIKTLNPWKKSYDQGAYSKAETLLCRLRSSSQGYGFSCGHVWL